MPATSVFMYWPSDRRQLHSFPTRRSSDLGLVFHQANGDPIPSTLAIGQVVTAFASATYNTAGPVNNRLEVHTAEVQSRPLVVCMPGLEPISSANAAATGTAMRPRCQRALN